MARPTPLLPEVKGMGRDFAVDGLPPGFVWDIVDYIPNRRGAKLEGRGPWSYLSSVALAGNIWGGKHAPFNAGARLLVGAGTTLYNHPLTAGAATSIGTLSASLKNGVMLRDRCYFTAASGLEVPKHVTFNGTTFTIASLGASAPKPKLIDVFKDRLVATGAPANPQRVSFSPLEIDGGPPGTWDVKSYVDTSRAVTAMAPMSAQILCFHSKSIERIRGSIPPGANVDTDMSIDMFSDQMGCEDPASVVNWQENVIFCNARGVQLTDGATIRSLTDQGAIGDFWRNLYLAKKAGTTVHAGVFLDYLFITVLTSYIPPGESLGVPVTLVCNLNERTWFRFSNVPGTCYIESEQGDERMWFGLDPDNKLTEAGPFFSWDAGLPDGGNPLPTVNAIDGNTKPVKPLVDLGWKRLGEEGVKRIRHIYVSHQTQTISPVTYPNVLQVDYETDIRMERDNMVVAGTIPNSLRYGRHRLKLGRRGYGIQVVIRQIAPCYRSRLYAIAVDEWAQDRGKL